MPRKKKEPLAGIGHDPETKLIVQKSKPLFELWRSNLSLAEFKIMDMYLARIDTHKPEQRTIKLTKGQLEQALGVTRINRPDLEQRLKNLYQPIDLAKGDTFLSARLRTGKGGQEASPFGVAVRGGRRRSGR